MALVFLTYSCGTHLVMKTDGCDIRSKWGEDHNACEKGDFKFKEEIHTVFSSFRKKELNVRELLRENGLVCSSLDSLRVVSQKSIKNFLWSLTPFFSQDTIVVSGTYRKSRFMDDVSHSMEGL